MLRKFIPLFLVAGFLLLIGGAILSWESLRGIMNWSSPGGEGTETETVEEQDRESGGTGSIRKKLNEIQVGPLDFENVTLEEAIDVLRIRTVENDPQAPSRAGVGFLIRGGRQVDSMEGGLDSGETDPLGKLITVKVEKAGLPKVLDEICEAAGMTWDIDPDLLKIVISPPTDR